MNLYLIKRTEVAFLDEVAGFVIRAKTPIDAREWASRNAGMEGGDVWLVESSSTCSLLAQDVEGDEDVLLRDARDGG